MGSSELMTLSRLSEIEERAEKATPGRWRVDKGEPDWEGDFVGWGVVALLPCTRGKAEKHLTVLLQCNTNFMERGRFDMDFAAHARSDIPALCKALRVALERISKLEDAAADYLYVGEGEEEWQASRQALLDAFGGEAAALAELEAK